MKTVIVCSACERTVRVITPVSPTDLARDFGTARGIRNRLGRCSHCHDVNLDVEQRDLFNRVVRRG